MTFGQLQARAAALADVAGYTDAATAPDWAQLINDAYAEFTWLAESHPDTLTLTDATVANQAEYSIATVGTTRSWKAVVTVRVGDRTLTRASEGQLRRMRPDWDASESGTPEFYVVYRGRVLRLYRPPDTASEDIVVRGIRSAAAMTLDSEYPDIPEVHHSALADRAYWEIGLMHLRGEERAALQGQVDRYTASVAAQSGASAMSSMWGVERRLPSVRPDRATL